MPREQCHFIGSSDYLCQNVNSDFYITYLCTRKQHPQFLDSHSNFCVMAQFFYHFKMRGPPIRDKNRISFRANVMNLVIIRASDLKTKDVIATPMTLEQSAKNSL